MESENAGYTLTITDNTTRDKQEQVYLRPMALYVPEVAVKAVAALIAQLPADRDADKGLTLTVSNNNNGVSVDKEFAARAMLEEPTTAADAVKTLVNIVRGYDTDEDTNVCGW
ncbi:DUF1869 domain-containing protein [[Enterobacter] lignolyticus]|uniref:Cytoplasmic protein n=2 Tax=[Enterobacter] lignolyticus TaxID=1334193 RepID=E3G3G6_ENTLS|nr:DUF1869 domain-containing protein [[Enterobacter] lignolyticus]ADO47043.1 Domain of unknown function DUF1869 [[Enterobacter] lignolyticus SCF1]ALR78050.1 hypothetical protein AO703_17735 [[Enterobacter] lignolyticus]